MRKLIFILCICFLTACDPIISYQFNVENKSDKELVFKYSHEGFYPKDSITICGKQKNCVIDSITIREANPHDEGNDFLSAMKILKVTSRDSSIITKDILDRKNWKYKNEISNFGIIKVGRNIYTLKIENNDFRKK